MDRLCGCAPALPIDLQQPNQQGQSKSEPNPTTPGGIIEGLTVCVWELIVQINLPRINLNSPKAPRSLQQAA